MIIAMQRCEVLSIGVIFEMLAYAVLSSVYKVDVEIIAVDGTD